MRHPALPQIETSENPGSISLTKSAISGDGLRHFAYQKEKMFNNGVTMDDIAGPNKNNANGIQGLSWAVPARFPLNPRIEPN